MILRDLIERKRDGGRLTEGELRDVAQAAAAGSVPDYQLAALLMAIFWRGLDGGETRALTAAMLASGSQLQRPAGSPPWIDKHSTGGVGDKTSLILAPLLASVRHSRCLTKHADDQSVEPKLSSAASRRMGA